jgi:hypothetical protein
MSYHCLFGLLFGGLRLILNLINQLLHKICQGLVGQKKRWK